MKQALSASCDARHGVSIRSRVWFPAEPFCTDSVCTEPVCAEPVCAETGYSVQEPAVDCRCCGDSEEHAGGVQRNCRPLFLNPVAAGFPSPADDYIERRLDLNEYLVRNPPATFFVRAQGDSMLGAGIHDGDILVVDRSIPPVHNRVVIAAVHGELTVKRLWMRDGMTVLRPENPAYPPLDMTGVEQFEVWGVVTSVIHSL